VEDCAGEGVQRSSRDELVLRAARVSKRWYRWHDHPLPYGRGS